ncbi:MAG TPA: hypothetical protein DCL21_04250, partial [Alphaproteobacteria bacterium]|nr:hypothetical protein [Alphaproteobacteria bacterium]
MDMPKKVELIKNTPEIQDTLFRSKIKLLDNKDGSLIILDNKHSKMPSAKKGFWFVKKTKKGPIAILTGILPEQLDRLTIRLEAFVIERLNYLKQELEQQGIHEIINEHTHAEIKRLEKVKHQSIS